MSSPDIGIENKDKEIQELKHTAEEGKKLADKILENSTLIDNTHI